MSKKNSKGSIAPVVLVARQPGASAVAVHGYKDGDKNLVTNALADGFSETASTFRQGETMTKIDSSSGTMGAEDLDVLVKVGECAHCHSALLSSSDEDHMAALHEVASTLADGQISCPACEEMTKLELPTADAAEVAAEEGSDDGEEAEEEEEETEDEDEDEDEDEESEEESEDEAEEDEEDEEESEDEAEEDEEDEEETEDDAEKDESSAADLSDADLAAEIASFVESAGKSEADQPEASKMTTISFDVSSSVAFETASVRVVPLKAGRIAVFADGADGEPINIGNMNAAHATEENASLFRVLDPNKLRVLQAGLCAALDANEDLSSFGFSPVVHSIPVAELQAQSVAEVEEAAVAEAAASIDAFKADYAHSLAIAAAGMNKGIYESPLHAAMTRELASRRVVGADRIATQIIASVGDEHMKAVIARADDLMKKTPEAREEAATLIRGAKTAVTKTEAPASSGSDLEIATAMLQIETPAPEPVAAKPAKAPVHKKRRFAY
jgi:hypothetical protein